jgi:alpha-beta hydrolase superfamily lysophospholipase
MKKRLIVAVVILAGIFVLACAFLYFIQEKLIFHPGKLAKTYKFDFEHNFEERYIPAADGTVLHGLLFKADSSNGLIFYLHGNAGSAASWGSVAKTYTNLNYDVFIVDYRGYGKSEGAINGEAQLAEDIQAAYDELKKQYAENIIVVLGYSIGTGPASRLASTNSPKLLILQAPITT